MRQARQQGLDAVFPIRAASPEPSTGRCLAVPLRCPGAADATHCLRPMPTTDGDERADDTRGRLVPSARCRVPGEA